MDQELFAAAMSARQNAYAPYSKFAVGAAVRTMDGTIFTGCNIENASYSLSICAERVAIFSAISRGYFALAVLCVVADTAEPVAPCGACRQVMLEFNIKEVLLTNCAGAWKRMKMAELLPVSFGPETLEK
jgi:cytidine deaminase